ncbi:MAG: 23S rRNA (guanosine(2251)-2'-O)-methyltransferase RlmB [Anaerolineaceae bacterium]|nr:23S rRNA (guanosine(2251)-2'-O)-methyltransferase RlmB [Anaerolineaceae bacterium]
MAVTNHEWIVGRNPAAEALTAGRRRFFRLLVAAGVEEKGRLLETLSLAAEQKLPIQRVPRQQLDSLAKNHQGVALEASSYPYADLADIQARAAELKQDLFVLLLDVIQDPQNLGTLLRTAEAVGVHGVLIPPQRAAGVTPAVVHSSAGACEHMLVASLNLAQAITILKRDGAWVIGMENTPDARPVEEMPFDSALALVVGGEGEGLRALTRRNCDLLLRLPMSGKVGSLNAAVAGSVVLYMAYLARLRKAGQSAPHPT